MFPEPEYAQDIIVGVLFRTTFAWYITEKEYWYLDYTKYDRALLAAGFKDPTIGDYSSRFHIAILNEDTADRFLLSIADRRVSAIALSQIHPRPYGKSPYRNRISPGRMETRG
jgi:hypothetical protein